MILGIGIDLFPIARLERELDRWGTQFLEEFLSEAERLHARELPWPIARVAASFAAKEAIFKTLGTGRTPEMRWDEIEILPHLGEETRHPGRVGTALFATSLPITLPPGHTRHGIHSHVLLHGAVERCAADAGIRSITLELEYSGDHAIAIAIAKGDDRPDDASPSSLAPPPARRAPISKGGLP